MPLQPDVFSLCGRQPFALPGEILAFRAAILPGKILFSRENLKNTFVPNSRQICPFTLKAFRS